MTRRASWQWCTALGVAVAVGLCAPGNPASPRRATPVGRPAHAGTPGRPHPTLTPLDRSSVATELAELSQTTGADPSKDLTELTNAPGMPTCAPPPVPAATYPPGASYGIPFLAAITNGQVLAGYDEWTANNLTWTVSTNGTTTTYHLDPWQSKIYDITGWVTGLLELPSLTAEIPPQDVVFCDSQGSAACLAADAPAGQCIHILAQYGPSPSSAAPPPGIGNDHPSGTSCYGYSTPTFECFPYTVSLTPSGDTSLAVSGVEPDGALDLQVTTSAVTTVNEFPPPPTTTSYSCQDAPTSIALSTVAPSSLPATAPSPPDPPNTDERTLQTAPQPLTGPLDSSTSTVAGNDFKIPAFVPRGTCSLFLAESLNTYAGGWDSVFNDQDRGLYYIDGGKNPIVAQPGWAQFSATTTVVTLGGPALPVGPPANFTF
jgi:hypothetical protein